MIEQLEDTVTWEAEPATPGRARALVERLLSQGGLPELVSVATLLTSEIVTNAVVHVGGTIAVRVMCRVDGMRVEVTDSSGSPPTPNDSTMASTGGRGLHLVDALATRWGATPDGVGKTVWFELAADDERLASND